MLQFPVIVVATWVAIPLRGRGQFVSPLGLGWAKILSSSRQPAFMVTKTIVEAVLVIATALPTFPLLPVVARALGFLNTIPHRFLNRIPHCLDMLARNITLLLVMYRLRPLWLLFLPTS